jgi:non-ribosomal peptide synthetase component F
MSQVDVSLTSRLCCLSSEQSNRVIALLQLIILELVNNESFAPQDSINIGKRQQRLADIHTLSQEDLSHIWDWNQTVPETVDILVHDLITEMVKNQPNAPAVCAWDSTWTYAELDNMSTRLAYYLTSLGVGPDIIVPLCFEKSR